MTKKWSATKSGDGLTKRAASKKTRATGKRKTRRVKVYKSYSDYCD